MSYAEHPPSPDLARVVATFWSFTGDSRDVERIAPDGRCELIVHIGRPYVEVEGNFRQPVALFAAQHTRPLLIRGQGQIATVSARLAPTAAAAVLHADASAFVNRRIALNEIDPIDADALANNVLAAATDDARFDLLADYLRRRISRTPFPVDARLEAAALQLERPEATPLETLAGQAAMSARQFERQFKRHVGVPARLYRSIVRFRRIFNAIAAGAASLSDAAQLAGYADHPQMARDFQRFLGCSASDFLREKTLLAAAMTRGQAMSE